MPKKKRKQSPRRPRQAKPRKSDSRNSFLNERELLFVAAYTGDGRAAALAIGASTKRAHSIASDMLAKPKVQEALRIKQTKAAEVSGEKQGEAVEKVLRLDRNKIISRAWDLANMSPLFTKGTITGQVRALDLLADVMAMKRAPAENPFDGKTEQELEFYATHGYWPGDGDEAKPSEQAEEGGGETGVRKAPGKTPVH